MVEYLFGKIMENTLENLWLDRLERYADKYQYKEHGGKICSWWLRLEYNNEASTAQINYWLNKSVEKGILGKTSTKSYTQYWLLKESND